MTDKNPAPPTVAQHYKFLMAKQDTLIGSLVDALDALGGHRINCREYAEPKRAVTIPASTKPTFEDLANVSARAKRVAQAAEQFRDAAANLVDQALAEAEGDTP